MTKQLAPSRKLAATVIFAAMNILVEKGGEAPGREVIEEIEKKVSLDDWAKAVYPKSGYTRWKSVLHFFSIDLIKAGFLIKKQGIWYITPEGVAAIKKGEVGLLEAASAGYNSWKDANPKNSSADKTTEKDFETSDAVEEGSSEQAQEATIQQMEQLAIDGLRSQIDAMNAYVFQDLVAALLRGMGYYTPFVAPKGKDGGVDVIAYQDPLGVKGPRIKVQIKHKEAAATVQEVRELLGVMQKEMDVGIFVSSSGYTSDAKATARTSHVHVELIDLDRFIALWQEFYPKLTDEDKDRLRLKPIYFYEPLV